MQGQTTTRAASVLLLAFIALVAAVVTSPTEFVFDEEYYANYVSLLHRYGLSVEFLKALTGAAGPLYAFVHFALEPVTQLQPIRMRLVNVVLLVVVAGILAACLKRRGCSDYLAAGGAILAVPMTWVLAGMALTEMPAMFFAALGLYLQLRAVEALGQGRPVLGWFIASGLSVGVAVWGRQPYLVLAGVPVLLALLDRRLWLPAAIFVGIVMALAMPLVAAWQALVPPGDEVALGLTPRNGLASLGYIGICFFLLAPDIGWFARKSVVAAAVLIATINAYWAIYLVYPFHTLAEGILSAPAMVVYGLLCGSLLVACGAAFFVWILQVTWQGREDLQQVAINASLICVALSPTLIGNYFSSRYAAMALPYLVLAAQPWRRWNWKTNLTIAAGCGIGLLSLLGYLRVVDVPD